MADIAVMDWLAAVPTAVAGMLLLGLLKKARDEKARKEKALAPAVARKKQQG